MGVGKLLGAQCCPMIILNEDRDQFACAHFREHPGEPITEKSVEAWADRWFKSPVTHCFVNPNTMTVLWDSNVFERQFVRHQEIGCTFGKYYRDHDSLIALLSDMCRRGVDPHAIFIRRARERGIEPWLSMRMNDVHYAGHTNCCYTSKFWQSHRELWRTPDYDLSKFHSQWPLGFDYSHEEVRQYHLRGLKEMLERYDVDGVELDWMRHHLHLTPGKEKEQSHCLTEFMRSARSLVDAVGVGKGRRLPIAARVTTRPDAALELGMDPFVWAKEGLIDLLIVCCYYDSNDMQTPIAEWKRRLEEANPNVKFLVGCEPRIAPEADNIRLARALTEAEWNGWVERGFSEDVDGFYFFNHYAIPRDRGFGLHLCDGINWKKNDFVNRPRAYPVSFCDAVLSSNLAGRQLPMALNIQRKIMISIGELPTSGNADVVFIFDKQVDNCILQSATINGRPFLNFEMTTSENYVCSALARSRVAVVGRCQLSALCKRDNLISIGGNCSARLTFCEIIITPSDLPE